MTEAGFVHKNTAYGVFFESLWARHKHLYPEELIQEEMVKFSNQCAVPWYNMSEQERDKFQEVADWSNAQQAAFNKERGEFTVLYLWCQEARGEAAPVLSLSSLASRVVLAQHLDTRELPRHLHKQVEQYRRLEGAFAIRSVDFEVARMGQGEVSQEEREAAWQGYLRSDLGKMMTEFEVVKRPAENRWSVSWAGDDKTTTIHLKIPIDIVHDNSMKKYNFKTQNYMTAQYESYLESGKVVMVSKIEEHQPQVGMALVHEEKSIFAIDESDCLKWTKRFEKPDLGLAYTITIRAPRAKTRGDRQIVFKYEEEWGSASQNKEG